MFSNDIAISVASLSKCYQIYETPRERLKQFVSPRMQRMLGQAAKRYFREFWAVKDVSLEVKKGETIGIIGRNGSGKSTLLQMICGTLTPTTGGIKTSGRVAALLELGSGFNPDFTGRDNIYMNASVLGLSREDIDARFGEIVAFADIGDFIEQPVKTYSSGMMVRLAFAVIANVDADILVIDEALAVGDAFFTQKCMRFLRDFMTRGTVLFVSHDTASIRSLCNRAIWIDKGQIVEMGHPKDVSERYLEAFFEASQGVHAKKRVSETQIWAAEGPRRDQRQAFLNATNLRNDIEVFQFVPDAASFGKRLAEIVDVALWDKDGHPLSWIVGGEDVVLRVRAFVAQSLTSPIIGFFVKDRLGQALFGDNTYISYMDRAVACGAGETIVAEFKFQMPRLASGDYSVSAAIADGTQKEHVQHHWIHDALPFRSVSTSVSAGLIGIPMLGIDLKKIG
jgi:lipopolysaccharide transport system ATP-binding protein